MFVNCITIVLILERNGGLENLNLHNKFTLLMAENIKSGFLLLAFQIISMDGYFA